MKTLIVVILVLAHGTSFADDKPVTDAKADVPRAIFDYVERPEPDFAWKLLRKNDRDNGRVYQLQVTSQKWHGIVWKHAVEVYEPKRLTFARHALLFVTGGSRPKAPDDDDIKYGLKLAAMCGARIVMLHQVPNQPLFDGRTEDDLITETWLKYLKTGDKTWPLLFPMVKSAVKTMDAVQALAKTEWAEPIDHFVITGASKRGWTSWLTPVVDKRVVATAPIVIDVLNFRAQMKHQLDTWGKFSEQIVDYSSKGLIKRPGEKESVREVELRQMMDPFTYRKQLKLPKLLIVATNDPYWVVDAMNLYWDELEGDKYILQVPNAGHGLKGGCEGALVTLSVFFRHMTGSKKLPRVGWAFSQSDGELRLAMNSDHTPKKMTLWTARSADLDFRDEKWESTVIAGTGKEGVGIVETPKSGHVAMFGELEFEFQGEPWSLSTLVYRR
jgi:PhoPQ-activated pathogenicity-related protein